MSAKRVILEQVDTNGTAAFPRREGEIRGPNESSTDKLARYIAAYAPQHF